MSKVFPILLRAHETAYYASSPSRYRDAFLTAWRADSDPKRDGWYAYDVTIHSRTDVSFVAYDMRDNLRGGIGSKVWEGRATVPADLTREDVEAAILWVAIFQRENELKASEAKIIEGYAHNIRAEIDETSE